MLLRVVMGAARVRRRGGVPPIPRPQVLASRRFGGSARGARGRRLRHSRRGAGWGGGGPIGRRGCGRELRGHGRREWDSAVGRQ
ncbi:hypothetical protein, partial [Phenylobacterium sp.]|uniref:hypothetical protein n=1 Tax=Phenylobacterium sp. TaxID=1871053 RepID=UPI002E300775